MLKKSSKSAPPNFLTGHKSEPPEASSKTPLSHNHNSISFSYNIPTAPTETCDTTNIKYQQDDFSTMRYDIKAKIAILALLVVDISKHWFSSIMDELLDNKSETGHNISLIYVSVNYQLHWNPK